MRGETLGKSRDSHLHERSKAANQRPLRTDSQAKHWRRKLSSYETDRGEPADHRRPEAYRKDPFTVCIVTSEDGEKRNACLIIFVNPRRSRAAPQTPASHGTHHSGTTPQTVPPTSSRASQTKSDIRPTHHQQPSSQTPEEKKTKTRRT